MKVDAHYMEPYGPYPIMMNINDIHTKAHVTSVKDQLGRIYIEKQDLKVRCIGHSAMLEQIAVRVDCKADLVAHMLDPQDKQLIDIDFNRSELIATNI